MNRVAFRTDYQPSDDRLVASVCLIDVDGVLRVDDELIPGAAHAIAILRERGVSLRFVTNTSVRSRASLRGNLASLGLSIGDDELFTAPIATAAYLRTRGYRRICLLVKGDVVDDFPDFEVASANVEAVVIGGAEDGFTYDAVNRAFQLVLAGAELVAIHRNLSWPTQRGLQIDAGAYVLALEAAAGVHATLIGKPSSRIFEQALADLALPALSAVAGCITNEDLTEAACLERHGIPQCHDSIARGLDRRGRTGGTKARHDTISWCVGEQDQPTSGFERTMIDRSAALHFARGAPAVA